MDESIKGIFFDLSETLIDTKNFFKGKHIRINKQILSSYGIQKHLKEIEHAMRKTYLKMEKYWKRNTSFSFILCKNLGIHVSKNIAKKMDEEFRKKFIETVELKPYVKCTLSTLSESYVLAVISNYDNKTNEEILTKFNIRRYFKLVVGIDTTGMEKRKIIPFKFALRKLKLTPNEVLMVGDDERQDINPAKKIGIKSVRIIGRDNEKTIADFQIKELKELILIVGRLHENSSYITT